jgi:Transposase DDE domain
MFCNFREYLGVIPNANLTEDYRINLTKNIVYELNSNEYGSRSEVGREGVRNRVRTLTNNNLIVIIMQFKSAIQRDLDCFFKDLLNEDFNIRKVTKSAFTKARAKLNPWGFKRLNEVAVNTFYEQAPYHKWHDRRILAIDGTRLTLPNHPTIVQEFGQQEFGPKADSKRSIAIGSVVYDCLNYLCLDSDLAPFEGSERDLLLNHLEYIKQGDVLLLDRGYPCFWLLFLLKAKKIDFCVRLKDDWWVAVNEFNQSDEKERIVEFSLPKKDKEKLAQYPDFQNIKIKCRLVKVVLETGETEILCTSLTDLIEFKHEVFKELYGFRWNEEEGYKLLKSRIEVERFSGKTALSVWQDFHAKILLMTITAAFAHPIEEKVRAEFKADNDRKHSQKINRTNALAMMRENLIGLFLKEIIKKAIVAFDKIVYKTRESIRPGRSFPRNHRVKKKYSPNYKPL